jgi:hypothetical protein
MLSAIRSKIGFLAGGKPNERIGIDLNGDTIKIARGIFLSGKIEIVDLFSKQTAGLSDPDIVGIISGYFKGVKTKNPLIINTIPCHMVMTKNIEVPSVDPGEIREIVNLQASRHTPYSRDEIVIDYMVTSVSEHKYTKILLIIVTRNAVKRQFDILDKAGVSLDKVLLASECFTLSMPGVLKIDTENSPMAMINIDDSLTDFTIVLKKKAIFIRSIPIGTRHFLSEKEKYEVMFLEEARKSIESYKSENIDAVPKELILTGALENIKDLALVMERVLEIPIRLVPYLNGIAIRKGALKDTQSFKVVSFVNAIACLWASDIARVNLIPEEIKIRKAVEERGRDLVKTGSIVITALVLIFLILANKIYYKGAYLNEMKSRYQLLNNEARELEKDFNYVNLMKHYLSRRGFALKVLAELYDIVPIDMELSDIRYEAEGGFSVRGTTEQISCVFTFVEAMNKSIYFSDVKTRYTRKRKEAGKDLTDFEVTSSLIKRAADKNVIN